MGKSYDHIIPQIKNKLKLEDLVSETVTLKRQGGSLSGFCPFHPNTNTPSFVVWPKSQTWKCFGACGVGGDIIAYLMKRDSLSFTEALEQLAGRAGLALTVWAEDREPKPQDWQGSLRDLCLQFHNDLFSRAGKQARAWLNSRGLDDDTLMHFRIGLNLLSARYGQHWIYGGITIPHLHRSRDTLWGVKIRFSEEGLAAWLKHYRMRNPGKPDPAKRPKYTSVPGSQQNLFNVDELPADNVLVCEGEFDVMLAWQLARDLATPVSLGSASSHLSYQWLRYTLPVRRFWLALDNDKAGQSASQLWQAIVGERGAALPLGPGQDITDLWRSGHDLREWLILAGVRQAVSASKPQQDFPVFVRWPANAEIAVPGGQWLRLADGSIEAAYNDRDEWELCLEITRMIQEIKTDAPYLETNS